MNHQIPYVTSVHTLLFRIPKLWSYPGSPGHWILPVGIWDSTKKTICIKPVAKPYAGLLRLGNRALQRVLESAVVFVLGCGATQAANLEDVVKQSFAATHHGWSCDEVLVHDERNLAFLEACRKQLPDKTDREFNWMMLNLRKAKKLPGEVTQRAHHKHGAYRHVQKSRRDPLKIAIDRISIGLSVTLCCVKSLIN